MLKGKRRQNIREQCSQTDHQRGIVEIPKPGWCKKHCTGRVSRKADKLVLSLMSMVRFIISPV